MDTYARIMVLLHSIALLLLSISLLIHKAEGHNTAEAEVHRCNIEWEA